MVDQLSRISDLPDDLEEIARSIPYAPRGLGILRQTMALLPPPLGASLQPSFPADEISPPEQAVNTMAGEGPGTISGGSITPGTVGSPQIQPGAIGLPAFKVSLRPVQIVDALPALPDPTYPPAAPGQEGSIVLLTTNGQIYRNVGDVWTAAVPAASGGVEPVAALPALPDADYPQGVVVFLTTDNKLYRSTGATWTRAVDGNLDITAGTITGDRLVAGTIDASRIAANTLTANEIAADAITSTELAALSVVAGKIAAAAVSATEIAAGAITADKIAANAVTIGAQATKGGNLLNDSSFEIAPATVGFDVYLTAGTQLTPYWASATAGFVQYQTHASLPRTGTHMLRITGDGVQTYPNVSSANIPVQPGRTYRLSAWMTKYSGAVGQARVALPTYDKNGANVANPAVSINQSAVDATKLSFYETTWTCPSDGTVSFVRVQIMLTLAPLAGDIGLFDDVCFEEVPGAARNSSGDVVIDSTGITISNGKLVLQDEFGKTSMLASGFSGSWSDFIALGLYNARFAAGTAGTIGLGRTSALPYWTVANGAGTPTLTYLDPGIRFTWAAINTRKEVKSDLVPMLQGRPVEVMIAYDATRAAGQMLLEVEHIMWDETLTFSTSFVVISRTITATESNVLRASVDTDGGGNYFHQIVIKATEQTAHSASNKIEVKAAGIISTNKVFGQVIAQEIMVEGASGSFAPEGRLWSPADGALRFDDGFGGSLKSFDFRGALLQGFSGVSFPLTPNSDDRFYRTDLDMWFFYDGTRWLSTTLYQMTLGQTENVAATALAGRYRAPLRSGGSDIWLVQAKFSFFVASGGTALGASHRWDINFYKRSVTAGVQTSFAAQSINNGASATWREGTDINVNALMNNGTTMIELSVLATKVGTPGNLYMQPLITYRIVAT